MRKVWVLVANGSLAKFYEAGNVSNLIEKKTLEHFESRLFDKDLLSDKPGQNTYKGQFGYHPYEEPTPQKVKEKNHFAEQIINFLEENFQKKAFERLYIIAIPAFLGILRRHLHGTDLEKTIFLEIHKDLTHMGAKEIRDYLPPVL